MPGSLVGDLFVVVPGVAMSRPKRIVQRTRTALARFLEIEASSGILLLVATAGALLWANLGAGYETFWHGEISIAGATFDLQHAVNDGLMTFFFLVVGLEIKRELVHGELHDVRVASLPLIAAVGGMFGPAVIYILLNGTGTAEARGWAIPMATDIAFVLGALSLFGDRVPSGLKLFALTLAIVDDIGAIAVIAIVYTESLDTDAIFVAALALVVVLALRGSQVVEPYVYLVPGALLWFATLRAGIHPTLAGVALGLLTPAGQVRGRPVLEELEGRLHPLSSYVVMPVFALANAGVVITGTAISAALGSAVFWGIAGGLVAGKTVGIFASSRLGSVVRLGRLPEGVHWGHLFGGAALSGIGFTVALFIAGLAFDGARDAANLGDIAKLAILAGSTVSALLGGAALMRAGGPARSSSR